MRRLLHTVSTQSHLNLCHNSVFSSIRPTQVQFLVSSYTEYNLNFKFRQVKMATGYLHLCSSALPGSSLLCRLSCLASHKCVKNRRPANLLSIASLSGPSADFSLICLLFSPHFDFIIYSHKSCFWHAFGMFAEYFQYLAAEFVVFI